MIKNRCLAACHKGEDEQATIEVYDVCTSKWFPVCDNCARIVQQMVTDRSRWREITNRA